LTANDTDEETEQFQEELFDLRKELVRKRKGHPATRAAFSFKGE
jgi:hypothetical protein